MYFKHSHYVKEDADFDELEDFDYVDSFISEEEEEELDFESEEIEDLDDLFLNDDDESEEDMDYDLVDTEPNIEIHAVCENCGHHWVDFISEEENETDFSLACPLCGSNDISRIN